ncbi:MAG: hypothetical protein WKG07_13885 [Hymenobacter sp.]
MPATHPALARDRRRYWAVFLGGYLGLAGAGRAAVVVAAGAGGGVFLRAVGLALGVGRCAQGGAFRAQRLAHSVLRGAFIFAVPLCFWPVETRALTNGPLTLAGAAPVSAAAMLAVARWLGPLVLAGHALLWGSYF